MTTNTQDSEQMNALIRAPRQRRRLRLVSENGCSRIVTVETAKTDDGSKNDDANDKGARNDNT
jgi:hypothetical protein